MTDINISEEAVEAVCENIMADAWSGAAEDTLRALRSALTEAEEGLKAAKRRGDNHWETLRGIREIARDGDCERIIQWVNDAGGGYTASPGETIKTLTDRAQSAEAEAAKWKKLAGELAGAARQVENNMCEGFCKDLPSRTTHTPEMEDECSVCHLRAALAAYEAQVKKGKETK